MRQYLSVITSVVFVAIASFASTARADGDWTVHVSPHWGSYMDGMLGKSPVTPRDFQCYAEVLGLAGEQTALAGELYADFAEEHRNFSTTITERRADLQAQSQSHVDWSAFQNDLQEISRKEDQQTQELTDRLFSDLRLILTPEQEPAWNDVERTRRRRETLPRLAVYPTERVDLVSIMEGLEMPETFRASLGPVMQEYERELDTVLLARNTKGEAVGERALEINKLQMTMWIRDGNVDEQAIAEKQQRIAELQQQIVPLCLELRGACARVRDVNDRYIRELSSKLPEKLKERFAEQTGKVAAKDQNAMPFSDFSRAKVAIQMLEQFESMKPMMEMQAQMFGDSEMAAEFQPYLDRMKNVPPLSPDQRAQLTAIKSEFEAQLAEVQRRFGASPNESDEPPHFTFQLDDVAVTLSRAGENMEGRFNVANGQPAGLDADLAKEKVRINQEAIDRIRAILTIEQRSVIAQY